MICTKHYEKLFRFIEVTAKILSVPFSGHGVVFPVLNIFAKFRRGSPLRDVKCRWGIYIS